MQKDRKIRRELIEKSVSEYADWLMKSKGYIEQIISEATLVVINDLGISM